MAVYIVTYDISDEDETKAENRRKKVRKFCEDKGVYLSESSYAIETDESANVVITRLKQIIDVNLDDLYVITLQSDWDGNGPPQTIAWLQTRL